MAILNQDYQCTTTKRCSDDSVVLDELERLFGQNNGEQGHTVDVTSQVESNLTPVRARTHEMTGQQVGPYRVIETLGQGGMGVVYLAHDTRLARKAALKAILPEAEHDAMPLERLRREARVLASLSHPNLATVAFAAPRAKCHLPAVSSRDHGKRVSHCGRYHERRYPLCRLFRCL